MSSATAEVEQVVVEEKPEGVAEKEAANPGIGTPQSTMGAFELPCGYLDPNGILHTSVVLSEMDGTDEDLIFSNLQDSEIVNRILARHLVSLGTLEKKEASKVVRDLTVGDRVYLMIALRRLSIGDGFKWFVKCLSCKERVQISLDLRDLTTEKMPDPMTRVFDETLPSGATVRWKVLNGHMEGQRDRTRKKMQNDRITFALFLRLEQIDGVPATMPALKKMKSRDRRHLRQQFDKREGGVETDVQATCPECSSDIETVLSVGDASFFFPTE